MAIVDNGLGQYVNLNWAPSRPDHRDFQAEDHITLTTAIAPSYSLAQYMHPILDQSVEGSCTAHGTFNAVYNLAKRLGIVLPELSRQAEYNWSRMLEGTLGTDAGAYIRDAVKVTNQYGMAQESLFPYGSQYLVTPPPPNVSADASTRKTAKYVAVPNDGYTIKATVAAGFPVIIGFSVPQNFMTTQVAQTGMIPMPSGSIIGGHCMCVDTYDDSTSLLSGPNSWSANWGDHGRFHMPYQFLQMMGADFWAVTELVGAPVPPTPPTPTKTWTVITPDGVTHRLVEQNASLGYLGTTGSNTILYT